MMSRPGRSGWILLLLAVAVVPFLAGCGDFWQAPTGTTVSTVTLMPSTTTPTVGASVTLTATLSPSTATGTVTFLSGTTSLGTGTISSGTATLTTTFSTAGTYSLTATYGGDTNNASSTSSAVSITVAAALA